MSNPKTTKTPELRYFIIERSALSAYGNENGSDKAEAERLLAESHSEVGDLVVIRGVAMSINPDAIGDGGAAMNCPRDGHALESVSGDYPTGVSSNGYHESRYEEGWYCERCRTVFDDSDVSAVCATPDCFDEPDPTCELCPACLREASRTVKHEWADQYVG